jgi:hypothetical protein
VVDFGVAMLDFSRDEPGAEDASIADHLYLIDRSSSGHKSVTGSFPEKSQLVQL